MTWIMQMICASFIRNFNVCKPRPTAWRRSQRALASEKTKGKTKSCELTTKQQDKIKLIVSGKDLEDVERFSYLGSAITVTGGAEEYGRSM